eukprot:TRINITY_DN4906_c0_g1_i2.p1 TRINITY_DN4906_c0_g1~~TRINITY_DN4906_c0_g1_i2.p1  ORF type:complete len:902 (+),score=121.85 TRINITY_DN4906_c0_g1_i2:87-2792(+)
MMSSYAPRPGPGVPLVQPASMQAQQQPPQTLTFQAALKQLAEVHERELASVSFKSQASRSDAGSEMQILPPQGAEPELVPQDKNLVGGYLCGSEALESSADASGEVQPLAAASSPEKQDKSNELKRGSRGKGQMPVGDDGQPLMKVVDGKAIKGFMETVHGAPLMLNTEKPAPDELTPVEESWRRFVVQTLESNGQNFTMKTEWEIKTENQISRSLKEYPYIDIWVDVEHTRTERRKSQVLQAGATFAWQTPQAGKALFNRTATKALASAQGTLHHLLYHDTGERKTCEQICVVPPHSSKRIGWSCIGLVLMLYDLVTIPLQVFDFRENFVSIGMGWISQIFWSCDMIISFVSGYYVNSNLEMRLSRTVRHYLSSWFIFDAIVVFPMWLLLVADSNAAILKNARVLRYLRMARVIRLLRLAKFNMHLQEALAHVNSQTLLVSLGMVKLMIYLMLVSHVNACLWFAVGDLDERGWTTKFGVQTKPNSEHPGGYRYLMSMHWALTQFQGTSDVLPGDTVLERVYCVFAVIASLLILSSFVSTLTNMMMQLQQMSAEKNKNFRKVIQYLNYNECSHALTIRVKKYVDWREKIFSRICDDSMVASILPDQFMMDIHFERRAPQLRAHVFFGQFVNVYPRLTRRLCHVALKPSMPAPMECLFVSAEIAHKMYFVIDGELAYAMILRVGEAVAQLGEELIGKGRQVSEQVLWTNWLHKGECSATEYCSLLSLCPLDFNAVVENHPQAYLSCVLYARRVVRGLRTSRTIDLNDIMEPLSIIQREWVGNAPNAATNSQMGRRKLSSKEAGPMDKTTTGQAMERDVSDDGRELSKGSGLAVAVDVKSVAVATRNDPQRAQKDQVFPGGGSCGDSGHLPNATVAWSPVLPVGDHTDHFAERSPLERLENID